jgi:hypothetical protein
MSAIPASRLDSDKRQLLLLIPSFRLRMGFGEMANPALYANLCPFVMKKYNLRLYFFNFFWAAKKEILTFSNEPERWARFIFSNELFSILFFLAFIARRLFNSGF